jgi:hypothetical protein
MSHALSDAEKRTFLDATNRRKAAGIKLGRISFMATKEQVESFNELFNAWVERWGKNKAVDVLLSMMSGIEARIRDAQ